MFEDNSDFDLDDDIITSSFATSRTNTPPFAFPETRSEFRKSGHNVSELVKAHVASVPQQKSPKESLEKTALNSLVTTQSAKKTISGILDSGRPIGTNGEFLEPCTQRSASVFDGGPWMRMLGDLNSTTPSEDSITNRYNIRWIKHNADQRKLIDQKVPFLAAMIENINANSTLTSINLTLKDPTGEIDAALLHTLYADYADSLTIGSVIVLRRFGVFSPGSKHFLTITANNLVTIYSTAEGKDTEIQNRISKNLGTTDQNAHKKGTIKRITVQKVTSEDLIKEVNQATNQSSISSRVLEDLLNLNKPATFALQSKAQDPPDTSTSAFENYGPCSRSNVEDSGFNKSSSNAQLKQSPMVQRQTTTPAPLKEAYIDNMLEHRRRKSILSLGYKSDISKNAATSNLSKHPGETVASTLRVEQKKSLLNEKENVDTSKFKKMQNIFGSNDDLDDFNISQNITNDMNFHLIGSSTKEYIKNNRAKFELDSNRFLNEEKTNNMNLVTDTTSKVNRRHDIETDFKAHHDKISFEVDDDLDLVISQEFSTNIENGSITKEYNKNNRARNYVLDDGFNVSIDEKEGTNLNFLTSTSSRIEGTRYNKSARDFGNKTRNVKGDNATNWAINQQFNVDTECEKDTANNEGLKSNGANLFELYGRTNMNFVKGMPSRTTGNIQNNRTSCFEADDDVNFSINEGFGISMNSETDVKTEEEIPRKRAKSKIRKTIPLAHTTSRDIINTENNEASCFDVDGGVNCFINEDFCTSTNFGRSVKPKGDIPNTGAKLNCELVTFKSEIRNTVPSTNTNSRVTRHIHNNRANYFEADDLNFSINEEISTTNFSIDMKSKQEIQNENVLNHEAVISESNIKNSVPLADTSNNINVGLGMRVSKVKSKLMKFRFTSRNKDAVKNDDENTVPKESLQLEGQEKDNLKLSEEPSVIMNTSQLSVKTTNIEHDEIWKNVLGDIDTDSLFEDF